ncbi:hypothetical protein ACU4GI_33325 [Cupriavidus basilensis]
MTTANAMQNAQRLLLKAVMIAPIFGITWLVYWPGHFGHSVQSYLSSPVELLDAMASVTFALGISLLIVRHEAAPRIHQYSIRLALAITVFVLAPVAITGIVWSRSGAVGHWPALGESLLVFAKLVLLSGGVGYFLAQRVRDTE